MLEQFKAIQLTGYKGQDELKVTYPLVFKAADQGRCGATGSARA